MRRDGARLCVVERAIRPHRPHHRRSSWRTPRPRRSARRQLEPHAACCACVSTAAARSRCNCVRGHFARANGTRSPWRSPRRIAISLWHRARSSPPLKACAFASSSLAATLRCSGVWRSAAVTRCARCSATASPSATRTCRLPSRSSTTRPCTRESPVRSRHPRLAVISRGNCSASCVGTGST